MGLQTCGYLLRIKHGSESRSLLNLMSILSHLGIVYGIGFATLEKTCQEGTQIAAVGSSESQF